MLAPTYRPGAARRGATSSISLVSLRHDWQMPVGICIVLSVSSKWLEAYRDNKIHTNAKRTPTVVEGSFYVGAYLLSRAASSQVSSARVSLTAVFGMSQACERRLWRIQRTGLGAAVEIPRTIVSIRDFGHRKSRV